MQTDRKKEEDPQEEKEDEERQSRETYGEGRVEKREEMGGVLQRESREMR